MIEMSRLKNVVIFIEIILSFVLSRKIINLYNDIAHKYGNVLVIYIYIYIYIFVCVCVYVCVCDIYIYIYKYIYIYIYVIDFRKYEKLEYKKNKLKFDIDFLNNCQQPKSF